MRKQAETGGNGGEFIALLESGRLAKLKTCMNYAETPTLT
jgi:hypothetical protein